jgi:hypothetical protein
MPLGTPTRRAPCHALHSLFHQYADPACQGTATGGTEDAGGPRVHRLVKIQESSPLEFFSTYRPSEDIHSVSSQAALT